LPCRWRRSQPTFFAVALKLEKAAAPDFEQNPRGGFDFNNRLQAILQSDRFY
jgi:hypothetical protein